ncbi:MAG TPA: hypothetical protein VGB55_16275 [Tepidisphaeraceae bacterium]|jgi:hypothetical protein
MSSNPLPGGQPLHFAASPATRIEYLQRSTRLQRLLNFCGWSIDDVVNNPLAKRDVLRWYKLGRWTERRLEIHELEKQWNRLK